MYLVGRKGTNYLEFEVETGKQDKVKYGHILGKATVEEINNEEKCAFRISEEQRDKWCFIAQQLDKEIKESVIEVE